MECQSWSSFRHWLQPQAETPEWVGKGGKNCEVHVLISVQWAKQKNVKQQNLATLSRNRVEACQSTWLVQLCYLCWPRTVPWQVTSHSGQWAAPFSMLHGRQRKAGSVTDPGNPNAGGVSPPGRVWPLTTGEPLQLSSVSHHSPSHDVRHRTCWRREVGPQNQVAGPSAVAADLRMHPVNFRPELQLVWGKLRDRWFP